MKYIHIKNLHKYHSGYKDRNLQWCKIYFTMLNADPEFELVGEIDKWRFIAFIMLELQMKKPIPLDELYFTRKGFNLKKRSMSLTLNSLHNFIEMLDNIDFERSEPVTQSRIEKDIEKSNSRIEGNYVSFEQEVVNLWNTFVKKYPSLSAIEKVGETRRTHLKKRFESEHFRKNFNKVLEIIPTYRFLMGSNKSGWRISFDWLIGNDLNYVKVLEGKYKDQSKTGIEQFIKER